MLMTFRQFSEMYPWPTLCGLRKYRDKSLRMPRYFVFAECFVKVNRRVLVDDVKFFDVISDFKLR